MGRMNGFTQLFVWASRFALTVAAVDFGGAAYGSLAAPTTMTYDMGMGMYTASAVSTARVQFGIYPLLIALTAIYCLTNPKRYLFGLGFLFVISAAAFAGYCAGLSLEGASPRNLLMVQRQLMAMAIYFLALVTEWYRRRAVSIRPAT